MTSLFLRALRRVVASCLLIGLGLVATRPRAAHALWKDSLFCEAAGVFSFMYQECGEGGGGGFGDGSDLSSLTNPRLDWFGDTTLPNSDPVLGSGHLRYSVPLLSLKAPALDFAMTATYNSAISNRVGIIGRGWDYSFNQRLLYDPARCDESRVFFNTGTASTLAFVRSGGPRATQEGLDAYSITTYLPEVEGTGFVLEKRELRNIDDYRTEWRLTDATSVIRTFDDEHGYLTRVVHPSGQAITLNWKPVSGPIDPQAEYAATFEIETIEDTAHRRYYFNYYDPKNDPPGVVSIIAKGGQPGGSFLQCVSAAPDPSCFDPIVRFEVNRNYGPSWGALVAITDANHSGQAFVYDTEVRFPVPYAPDETVDAICEAFCGDADGHVCEPRCSEVLRAHDFCDRLAFDEGLCRGFCYASWREFSSPDVARCWSECANQDGGSPGVVGNAGGPDCRPGQMPGCVCDELISGQGLGFVTCAEPVRVCRERLASLAFCDGYDPASEASHSSCRSACHTQFESAKPPASVVYGDPSDLLFNLTEVYAQSGELVLKNWYGADELSPDFDKVIVQQLGAKDANDPEWAKTHILRFEYHDLDAERDDSKTPGFAEPPNNQARELQFALTSPKLFAERPVDELLRVARIYAPEVVLAPSDYLPIAVSYQEITWETPILAVVPSGAFEVAVSVAPQAVDYFGGALALGLNDTYGRYVDNLADYTPWSICQRTAQASTTSPGWPVPTPLPESTYAPATAIVLGPNQVFAPGVLPRWAVVTYANGNALTQYYRSSRGDELLREVNHHLTDGRPAAVTDYAYTHGFRTGVREPSGVRMCSQVDPRGRPLEVVSLPAPNKPGGAVATAAHFYYDARGDLTLSTTTARGAPINAVGTFRDAAGRVTASITQASKAAFRTTTYDFPDVATRAYDADRPVSTAPTRATQLPAKVRTDYFDYDPSGQAKRVVANATSLRGPPVTTVATFDAFGRTLTAGRDQRGYDETAYDLGGRPLSVKTYLQANTVPVETVFTYGPNDDSPWPVTVRSPKVERQLAYDVYGRIVATRETGLQSGGTQNHCTKRRISDGLVLEEVMPEGEMLKATLDGDGHVVRIERGYPAVIPAWAAWCADNLGGDARKKPGFETTYEATYDDAGLLVRVVEGGVEATFSHDGFGRVIERRNALGERTRTGFDAAGRAAWDAHYGPNAPLYAKPVFGDAGLMAVNETSYDMLGRPTALTRWHFEGAKSLSGNAADPRETTSVIYDDAQMYTASVDAGRVSLAMLDGAGRKVATCANILCTVWTTPAGAKADLEVSEWRMTAAGFNNTTQVFDTLGRFVGQHDGTMAMRDLSRRELEVDGTERSAWSAATGLTLYDRDSFGRVLTETRVAGPGVVNGKTSYEWNDHGQLIAIRDGSEHRTERVFDGLGRLVASTDPLLRATVWDYHPGSQRVWHQTDPAGTLRETTYDAAGRPATERITHGAGLAYAGQTTVRTYRHSPAGRVASVALSGNPDDPMDGSSVTMTHDSLGNRLTETSTPWNALAIQRTFDRYSALVTTTLAGGTTRLGYQFDGRLAHVAYQNAPIATVAYNGAGGPSALYYGNATAAAGGLIQQRTYDRLGYFTGLTVALRAPAGAVPAILQPIASERHAVTVGGIPIARERTFANAAPLTDVFRVDASGRVQAENLLLAKVPLLPPGTYATSTTFDAYFAGDYAGRSLRRTVTADASDGWSDLATGDAGHTHADRDAFGQVTAYAGKGHPLADLTPAYDPASNLTALGALGAYAFDGLGRPVTVSRDGTKVRYLYDALGRRVAELDVARGTFTVFVWDGDHIAAWGETEDPTMAIEPSRLTRRVMTGARSAVALIRREGPQDVVRYLAQGADGSVLALFDAKGLTEGASYSAFGDLTLVDGAGASHDEASAYNRFFFQGALYQPHTKTYAMGAREYAPEILAWLSPDPGGVTSDGPNLYAFVGGRPLQLSDPSGYERALAGIYDMNDVLAFDDELAPETDAAQGAEGTDEAPGSSGMPQLPEAGDSGDEAQLPAGLPATLDEMFPGGSQGVRLETLLGFVPPAGGVFAYEDPATHTRMNFTTQRAFASFYGMLDTNAALTSGLQRLFARGESWTISETEDPEHLSNRDGGGVIGLGIIHYETRTIEIAPAYGEAARALKGAEYDYNEILAHELGHAIEGSRADGTHGDYATAMGNNQRERVDGLPGLGRFSIASGWVAADVFWLQRNDPQALIRIGRELTAYREAGIPWSDIVPPPPPRR